MIVKAGARPGSVSIVNCDLSDWSSVREAGKVLAAEGIKFDVLFLNAGVMALPQGKTKEGFESHIGPNHFGHFLLTHLIRESDLLNEKARVIIVSSDAPYLFKNSLDLDDLNWEKRPYSRTHAYSASKSANILMAMELHRQFQLEGKGRQAISLHPGFVRTKVVRDPSFIQAIFFLLYPLTWTVSLSPLEGTQCSLHAATTDEDIGGKYLHKLRPRQTLPEITPENARKLWSISEKAFGLSN